jgi:hypothetical protein
MTQIALTTTIHAKILHAIATLVLQFMHHTIQLALEGIATTLEYAYLVVSQIMIAAKRFNHATMEYVLTVLA